MSQTELPRFLSYEKVCELLGQSRSTIKRLVRDNLFPQPITISSQRVGFLEEEVKAWVEERMANRDKPVPVFESRRNTDLDVTSGVMMVTVNSLEDWGYSGQLGMIFS